MFMLRIIFMFTTKHIGHNSLILYKCNFEEQKCHKENDSL